MLKAKKTNQCESFNDGVLNVLEAVDGVIKSNIQEHIRYGNRTFGVSRFFKAEVSGSVIQQMISIPFNDIISRDNIVELKDFRTGKKELFEIVMLQEKYDTAPKCIYLTLKKTSIQYVDKRTY